MNRGYFFSRAMTAAIADITAAIPDTVAQILA